MKFENSQVSSESFARIAYFISLNTRKTRVTSRELINGRVFDFGKSNLVCVLGAKIAC